MTREELPLRYSTPDQWADRVLQEPLSLLSDHAYLEKKAALNVLDLLNRWPDGGDADDWTATMAAVARDETTHLTTVTRVLRGRGGKMERAHKNGYAYDLHKLVRRGRGNDELLDRLLISALIEARSCERFAILAERCADLELRNLYGGLWASELGHYNVFLRLAESVSPETYPARWDWMLAEEARIIASQPPGPRLHSGVPSAYQPPSP